MKHLFSCLKSYRKEAVLSPLFKLFEATLELLVPLVVGAIVNNGIASADVSYIVYGCLILVGLGAVGLAFSLTAQYFAARAAVGVSAELRERLFVKLQSFSYTQIDRTGTSAMITRMTSDVNQVQTGVNMTLRLFLRSPFIVLGAMAMAFVVDPTSALVFVAVIPLLGAAVSAIMAACLPLYKKVQERLDKVYLSTRENLTGVRVIRAFCKEEDEIAEFKSRNGALKREQKKVGRIAALMNPLTYVLVNLAVVALLWVAAGRVNLGALEQGNVISLYSYLAMILVELVKFANLVVTVTRAVSSQKRIGAVLDEEGETDSPDSSAQEDTEVAVRFERVTFSYEGGGAPALKGINLSVRRGETVGILGGTGSGKSTLVNLIPRFYTASEGKVFVNGRDVNAYSAEELREKIGVVPQKAALFRGTIRSNLLWGKEDATEEELFSACRTAQAEDVVAAKGGLDGEIAQEGRNLSGGQRQRLTIARALVKNPEILILDDSSSALDYATDARLRAALRKLDCTVFIVSQRASSVMHADQILVLDDGAPAGLGTHEQLLASCEVYREIYDSQFGGKS
ncbi:MAG: ABC transporter ATP-binding protein [Candidatus Gallimonas sp.]